MFTRDGIEALHGWTHGCIDEVIRHARTLSPELFGLEIPGFGQPSLRQQLMHILSVEEAWVRGLRSASSTRVSADDHPTLTSLIETKRHVAAATVSYLHERTEVYLNTQVSTLPKEWVGPPRSPAFIILHVITHTFHHKGQMASMFRMLGHPAPDTDLQR
jgi:uncharacterized damage-inducible protein DinB